METIDKNRIQLVVNPTEEVVDFLKSLPSDLRSDLRKRIENLLYFKIDGIIERNGSGAIIQGAVHADGNFFRIDAAIIWDKKNYLATCGIRTINPIIMDDYLDMMNSPQTKTEGACPDLRPYGFVCLESDENK